VGRVPLYLMDCDVDGNRPEDRQLTSRLYGGDERVRIRQAASFASREGREVGTLVFHAAGAQAIFAGGPWERRLRDLHTVSQQLQGRDDHFEAVGRFLLGLAPDSPFI